VVDHGAVIGVTISHTSPWTSLALALLLVLGGCTSSGRDRVAEYCPSGWPTPEGDSRVSSGYGARRGGSHHEGVDLSAPRKAPVVATAAGTVISAGPSHGDYGRMVVIDHGHGFETRYAHLARVTVNKGDRVRRGDRIGLVGKSGNATGYHLHYEVRRHVRPVDPWPFVSAPMRGDACGSR